MKVIDRLCLVILALALLAPSAWPQASTATVSGTVPDQTGAVIPAARAAAMHLVRALRFE